MGRLRSAHDFYRMYLDDEEVNNPEKWLEEYIIKHHTFIVKREGLQNGDQ